MSSSPTHFTTKNNNFNEEEDSLEKWFRRAFGERETEFKSDHVKLQLLCKQFFDVVETARKAHRMPHPIATSTAAHLFRKLAALRPSTDGVKTDTLCTSLLRLVYADQRDPHSDPFEDSKHKKSLIRSKLENNSTPLSLLVLTPYYDLVRELQDNVKAFESEYETFQVEFDEVKEMVQRSHRVIGTALKRWEDFFMRVTFKHWAFQVRGNVKVKKFTQRLRESIRMACHREILDKHFQAWMCYLLEIKYQRAEEKIESTNLQIEGESKRHKRLVSRLHEVEKHIRVVTAGKKKIVDENINLKSQFAESYNKDHEMNFAHREFFKANPEFFNRTRHDTGTVFDNNCHVNEDVDLENPNMLCGFSALTLNRLKFLVLEYEFEVTDLKSFHFRICSWLVKIAPELQDIYKHYAHTDTVKISLKEEDGKEKDDEKEEEDKETVSTKIDNTKSLCGKDMDALCHDARLYGAAFQRNELAEIVTGTNQKVGLLHKSNKKKKKKKWKAQRGTIKSLASLVPSLLRNATVDRNYENIPLMPTQFVECVIRIAFEKASRTRHESKVVRGPRYIMKESSSSSPSNKDSQWNRLKKKSRAAIFVQRKTRKKRMSFMPGSILSVMQVASKDEEKSGGGDAPVLLEWLQYVCDDHIFMYAHTGAAQAFLRETIAEVRKDKDLLHCMHRLFNECAGENGGVTICLSQFVELVRKCDEIRHCLSREVVYEMFAYVQQRDTRHEEDHSILDDERIECSFDEFVLCLCACACRSNPNPYEPLLMRVRVFVQTLVSSTGLSTIVGLSSRNVHSRHYDTSTAAVLESGDLFTSST